MVECNLAKVEVASSNLVSRSIFPWNGSTIVGLFFIDRLKISQYKLKVCSRVGVLLPEGVFSLRRDPFLQNLVRG